MKTSWASYLIAAPLCLAIGCGASSDNGDPAPPDIVAEIAGDTKAPASDAPCDDPSDTKAPASDTPGDDPGDTGGEIEKPEGLPRALPFTFARPDHDDPLDETQIREFTAHLTAFWKELDYFSWVLRTTCGVHASTGYPDFRIWWHDANIIKEGETITFRHCVGGGDHNVHIPTSKVLSQAIATYLATGDEAAGRVTEQFCKGFTQTMRGMVYDENDPVEYLMARNVYTFNHEYDDEEGRPVVVDYSLCYSSYEQWNTNRFRYQDNPYWGEVWVTNERSKDDLCHILRTSTFLPFVVEDGADPDIRAACGEALELLELFAADIVDHDYQIRTKGPDGEIYIPTGEDKDLASLKLYTWLDPRNECPARMATALLGYGDPREQDKDCDTGFGSIYDDFATVAHYYNQAIIRNFHMAAAGLALLRHETEAARNMLEGLAQRADHVMDPPATEPGLNDRRWHNDVAVFLLQSASVGLPLKSAEAAKVIEHYTVALDSFETFERFDIRAPEVPDGNYSRHGGFRPLQVEGSVHIEEIFLPMEYCASPFANPEGQSPVDCRIVLNPELWGTTGD